MAPQPRPRWEEPHLNLAGHGSWEEVGSWRPLTAAGKLWRGGCDAALSAPLPGPVAAVFRLRPVEPRCA